MKLIDFRKALLFLLATTVFISCEKNQPPSVRFLKPADGYTASRGDVVSISLSADDTEGTVTQVRLYINEEGLASLEFPYNYKLNTGDYSSGSYTLEVTARDDEGLEASEEIEIIIDAVYSIVSTTEATDISYNSAVAGGVISENGGAEITERGIYWDTISSPETTGIKVPMGQGLGEFTGSLTELPHGKQIYYRSYAVNSAGISTGKEFSFTSNTVPTVNTIKAKSVDYISAIVGGEITSDGGEVITEVGVYWSTEALAERAGTRLIINSKEKSFSTTLEDLSYSTTYYIKAFALNAAGESLGEEKSFTTTGTATVKTLPASSTRYKTLLLNGEISDNGGNEVSETGFYFGTSPDPSNTGNRIPAESEIDSFSCTQTDLVFGNTYYYTAFAVNIAGESIGEEMSFEVSSGEKGTLTDPRDQEVYGTIEIGEQVWMSENLKASLLNDGTEILHASDNTSWSNNTGPAYCWPDNDLQWEERGALYNWYTVETEKLCPAGWHVPTEIEWRQLEYYLGMDENTILTDEFRGENEGGMLKTTSLWDSPNAGATNETLFSALPTGRRGIDGECLYLNTTAFFWSSTLDYTNRPLRRLLYFENGQISRVVANKNNGISVRCIKDVE